MLLSTFRTWLMCLLFFMLGLLAQCSHHSQTLQDSDELLKKLDNCDTEVLRVQKELNAATEAFWRSR